MFKRPQLCDLPKTGKAKILLWKLSEACSIHLWNLESCLVPRPPGAEINGNYRFSKQIEIQQFGPVYNKYFYYNRRQKVCAGFLEIPSSK